MLSEALPPEELQSCLIPQHDWHPYPTASDRSDWENLPSEVKQAHLDRGLASQSQNWSTLTATGFMHYYRSGDYMDFQKASFSRRHKLRDMVTAECIAGDGRFIDDIIDGVWMLCEESFWGPPPNTWVRASEEDQVGYSNQRLDKIRTVLPDVERPGVDLWVGETAGVLAWTAYLLKDQLDAVSPLIVERITHEITARVLTPCHDRNFLWMGFLGQEVGNWNPWCNSNWLTCILLTEQDPDRRLQAVTKSLNSLDKFLNTYAPDGGCNEGPGYWGRAMACLFDCIELLDNATGQALDLYGDSLLKEMAAYIYRVHIDDRYFVNFSDSPGSINVASDLVYRLGGKIGDDRLKAFGVWASKSQQSTFGGSLIRELPALFGADRLSAETGGSPPLARDAWLSDIQVMTARSNEGTSEGLYLAVKGGHNREHHNHNDVGNFIIYTDGLPAIVDAGVGTYTRQNSGPNRYDIWTMKSGYHNLPTINDTHQGYGREFSADVVSQSADDKCARIEMDITKAWPLDAQLESWIRTLTLNRGRDVKLEDTYKLTEPGNVTLGLITPCEVSGADGELCLGSRRISDDRPSGSLNIEYDSDCLAVKVEEIVLDDAKLNASWGEKLFRILFTPAQPVKEGSWSLGFTQS
jgi:hypothetical protein